MAQKRIRVRGKQKADIDPQIMVQILLAIGEDLARQAAASEAAAVPGGPASPPVRGGERAAS